MEPELCFFLEVRLGSERTATIHKHLTGQGTDKFREFKETSCYTKYASDDETFWRGPYWGYKEAVGYAGVHGWTPKLCSVCFPPELDGDGYTADDWAAEYFKSSKCTECGQDRDAHNIVLVNGHWFAKCKGE